MAIVEGAPRITPPWAAAMQHFLILTAFDESSAAAGCRVRHPIYVCSGKVVYRRRATGREPTRMTRTWPTDLTSTTGDFVMNKKLILNRETLKVLSPSDARRVQGGMRISDMRNCSEGNPCTSGCTTGSQNCTPPTFWC
jgi:hypothetical protein